MNFNFFWILIFRNGDGWEEGYYEYDYEAEGWYQDELGEWHQVHFFSFFFFIEKKLHFLYLSIWIDSKPIVWDFSWCMLLILTSY